MVIRHRVAVVVAVLGGCSFKAPTELDATPPPTIAFEFDKSGADEQVGTVMLPIVLSKPSGSPVTAKVTVLAGGSADDADFELQTAEVTFDPDVTRVMVPVVIKTDLDETESDEVFTIAISDPVGAKLDVERAIHEVKIADHLLPRIKFATASVTTTTTEGTPTTLTIELTAPSEGESTFTLGVTPGANSPTDSEDLAVNADTIITIPNGETMVVVPLGQVNDALDEEDNENVAFDIKGASQNLVPGTEIAATHAIADDDLPPVAEFSVVSTDHDENGGTITLEVTLTAESGRPITVDYARNAGSSAVAADATINGTTLSFAPRVPGTPGQTSQTFTVAITDDNIDEDAEQLLIDLVSATNASIVNKAQYTLGIRADAADVPTVAFMNPTSSADEDEGDIAIQVRLSNPSTKVVTVTYTVTADTATQGQDYNLTSPGQVVFQPLDVQEGFVVDLIPSGANNPDETVNLQLSSPNNATLGTQTTHVLTIRD